MQPYLLNTQWKDKTMNLSRRSLLKFGTMTGVGHLTSSVLFPQLLSAATSAADDYKALVCIALNGGCDGNNVIVPMSGSQYGLYRLARQGLALEASSLLACSNGFGQAYGLNGALKNIAGLYSTGNAAVLTNVGSLGSPVTRAEYLSGSSIIPTDLMNHESQCYQWATSYTATGATAVYTGWGGRLADRLQSLNLGAFPVVTSLAPAAAEGGFCFGQSTYPAVLNPAVMSGFPDTAIQSLQVIAKLNSKAILVSSAASDMQNALTQSQVLSGALAGVQSPAGFPTSDFGVQLSQVLKMIKARRSLGMQRQIFLCVLHGFDNHLDQLTAQQAALADLDNCVGAFQTEIQNMGLQQNVTTFTTSDFGRTLQMNTLGGSDHAWGNHQFIIGGAVKGGRFYGQFPNLSLSGPDDYAAEGRWIPTTSVDQYGSTLAAWFGVPTAELTGMFPNLKHFSQSSLGFV